MVGLGGLDGSDCNDTKVFFVSSIFPLWGVGLDDTVVWVECCSVVLVWAIPGFCLGDALWSWFG